ncbi:MAG: SpoIVB peptidase S55 domain-containing protein [Sandaracinaceae bacterium]
MTTGPTGREDASRAQVSRALARRAQALCCALVLALPFAMPEALVQRAIGQVRAPTTMSVAEVRPGMRGYGLTVFRGTQPERFEVEVIDVLHQFRPDQDLILIRTTHPILTDAPTVGGMSGSPIFLEDRLVGAYAYGWPFGRHPVAGVTPIENMMRELRRTPRPGSFPGAMPLTAPGGTSAPRSPSAPRGERIGRALPTGVAPYLGIEPRTAFSAFDESARPRVTLADGATLVPASTPLLVGGLDPEVLGLLRSRLEPFGIDVLQAGGAGTPPPAAGPPPRFVDGGALAVTLARGDVASTVVGTVTHVEGDRLVAFGHPMVEAGETGFPTAVARVLHVLASFQRSFKIAEPVAPLGTMIQDRQAAVVVDTTLQPAMIPVHLRITGVPTEQRTDWRFEVASHRAITPLVIGTSIQSAVKAIAADNEYVMFEARSRVRLEGVAQPIELVDRGFASTGASQTSALGQIRAFDAIEVAYANPFRETRVLDVDVEIALRFARDTAEIVDASVAQTEVDPGEPVEVRVVLRRWSGDEEVRRFRVEIPESAAGQSVQILVQPGNDVEIERPEPRGLDDVIEAVRDRYGASELVLSTRLPGRGLRTPGHVVRSVPLSVLDALQSTTDSDRVRAFQTHVRRAFSTDLVLTGAARVELSVRRVPR